MPALEAPNAPRPFADCPAAELAAIDGLLTDIDDTLTRDGAIEPAALAALHDLAAAGLPVIAITGRGAGWSEPFARDWPLAAIVAENGAVMLRRSATGLQRDFLDPPAVRADHARRLAACARAIVEQVPDAALARDSGGRITDIAIDHGEYTQLSPPGIAAVVQLMRRHGLNATVSSIHVNGWIGSHSKWTGATWAVGVCCARTLDPRRWLYVGDSANDEPMFERLPHSVGVANIAPVLPRLRVPPAWVTGAERGQGFAEVAARWLAARGH